MTHSLDVAAGDPAHEVARDLAAISGVLLGSDTVVETLQRIASLAAAAVDSCDTAALCTDLHPPLDAAASPLARTLDDLQHSLAEGPCHDARGGADDVFTDDFSLETRWSTFAPLAVAAGVRSAVAYRLTAGGETQGALTLYAEQPAAFSAADRAVGAIFAAHASIALSRARSHDEDHEQIANLQTALRTRELIGQAQGILMERERITAEAAFTLLRKASQRLDTKLRDIAQELIDTGTVQERDSPRP
jgi:GAF domain-containing protein